MTAEPSPRPWRAVYARILDARGKSVCVCEKDSMHGRADDNTATADAALIVAAVNFYDRTVDKQLAALLDERDRLRDIVRRLADNISRYHLVGERERALLREARAAIGKDASP